MNDDWTSFEARLRAHPAGVHQFQPSAIATCLERATSRVGALPSFCEAMLSSTNGIELFINGGPFATLFGVSPETPVSTLEWAPDWYIDAFTPTWRKARNGGTDVVTGVTCYGTLFVFRTRQTVQEWDTQAGDWCSEEGPVEEWLERLIVEGEEFMKA